jgi:hypothetical protein
VTARARPRAALHPCRLRRTQTRALAPRVWATRSSVDGRIATHARCHLHDRPAHDHPAVQSISLRDPARVAALRVAVLALHPASCICRRRTASCMAHGARCIPCMAHGARGVPASLGARPVALTRGVPCMAHGARCIPCIAHGARGVPASLGARPVALTRGVPCMAHGARCIPCMAPGAAALPHRSVSFALPRSHVRPLARLLRLGQARCELRYNVSARMTVAVSSRVNTQRWPVLGRAA